MTDKITTTIATQIELNAAEAKILEQGLAIALFRLGDDEHPGKIRGFVKLIDGLRCQLWDGLGAVARGSEPPIVLELTAIEADALHQTVDGLCRLEFVLNDQLVLGKSILSKLGTLEGVSFGPCPFDEMTH